MKNIFNRHNLIKKLLLVPAILVTLMSVNSCSEDFLDQPSPNTSDTQSIFESLETADLFVQGCYRGIVPTEMFYQLGAGDTVVHSAEDGTTNNSKYNICNYFYDAKTPYTLTGVYSVMYASIERTNIAISGLSKMPESPKRNALLAEVKALRAFCYYNLIRVYGDVPAVWIPLVEADPNDPNTLYPKRSSRDGIYDRIIADMQGSVNDLPTTGTSERLKKASGNALLARIALYAAGYSLRWDLNTGAPGTMSRRPDNARVQQLYQIADAALESVITGGTNSLVQAQSGKSGFEAMWFNFCQRKFGVSDPEMLWHIAEYGPNTNSAFGVYAMEGSRGGTYGSRKALQFILPSYYLSFNPGDTRRDVSCTSYSIYFLNAGAATDTWVNVGTTYSCILPGKFRMGWGVAPQAADARNLNIPIIRYADVLLMFAETQNYLNGGPTAKATAALQQVRTRAGIGSLPIPGGQQAFENALVQERKWEFAGEFNLRTDLIRMNRIASEIEATKLAMKNLSNRTGAYAATPTLRLYKFEKNAQVYGDPFLALKYIDLTNPVQIAAASAVPTSSAGYAAYQTTLAGIVTANGQTVAAGDKWYPTKMFEAYTSTFNGNARKAVGFTGGFNAIQVGAIIYTKPTGSAENGGTYPNWIEGGGDGLFYGFVPNKTELLPFASASAGHPMVDNPNLTQLPGY
ncbi:RagB/SusD family nutrient uptake outer membrane protein [Chryseobacterium chendengshani]|uniref:RagB/SusD family nutrient uptake outer membrane protein n=1 Tax=Chryseobacterium sp. LJ668 TaxID=2864040 RepID=UPI001C68EC47|nr:RagB/SusD family nutrient uptake outer membrane protein [Chryseobacterium sp. LJ668]MBW8523679.1 RagB/SusD family nutrient uptake outer membrane protein [Chryseobacterium sp. LJ668]QYK15959.1 RagB/SusD family nutrient uptake outer membrane protein [Chryseobacterium sp. LJ668]